MIAVLAKRAEKLLIDNSPLILTGLGAAGTIATALFTGRASFKAADILAKEDADLPLKEKAKLTWKLYIPAVTTGAITVTAIILANRIGTRRAAALAAAYSLSEKAFAEYKDKVIEKLGERKEEAVRAEIAQDRIDKHTPSGQVIISGNGDVLCYDEISGRYFMSDMEKLRRVQNDLNHTILHYMYASLHDFYESIGLPPTKYSSEVGWTNDAMLDMKFSTCLSEDNRPCISIGYVTYPVRDYY